MSSRSASPFPPPGAAVRLSTHTDRPSALAARQEQRLAGAAVQSLCFLFILFVFNYGFVRCASGAASLIDSQRKHTNASSLNSYPNSKLNNLKIALQLVKSEGEHVQMTDRETMNARLG